MSSPETASALALELRACVEAGKVIQLGGAFTKDRQGGPIPASTTRISTSALRRVLKYEPHDLTISVEAGLPWTELEDLLAANGQMLPLDPPFAARATVGGVVASNCAGPRRRAYGSARDMVIGMTYATLQGTLVPSGGMVVKNVAGLDLAKMLIGSLGTLAAITIVNFKVVPRPPARRAFALAAANLKTLFQRRTEILASVLQPSAIDILNAASAERCGLERVPHLLIDAAGSETVLRRFAAGLPDFSSIDDAVWKSVREWIPAYLDSQPAGCIVRTSSKLSEMCAIMETFDGPSIARAGNGIVYAAFPTPEKTKEWLAAAKAPLAGTVVEFSPADASDGLTLWPDPGDAFPLMQRVKMLYDPKALLNPGRYYGRL